MSEAPEVRGSVVFICALNPNPIMEFDKVTSVRNSRGEFMPAIRASGALANGGEHLVRFPIFSFDCPNEEKIEEARKLLHERLDRTFDNYKKTWAQKAQERAEAKPKTIKEAVEERRAKLAEERKEAHSKSEALPETTEMPPQDN